MNKTITLLGLALTLSPFATAAATESMWIHGSWVNVRATAEAGSAVIEHVTTNTKVEVAARDGKTCEIVWGKAKRGFVPCSLLGEKPLTLAETNNPLRRFWIAPSANALFHAGQHLQTTLLSKKQWNLEHHQDEQGNNLGYDDTASNPPKIMRYPVPEFEAMKALLAKGIVAGADRDLSLLNCQQIQATSTNTSTPVIKNLENWFSSMDCSPPPYTNLDLPKVRPSFFKNAKNIIPGDASTEHMSAHFGIVEHGKVTGEPYWNVTHDEEILGYSGVWDIGSYGLELDKPVFEHVIGRSGLVGAYKWQPQDEGFLFNGEHMCEQLFQRRSGDTEPVGDSVEYEDTLLVFHSPVALPLQKAKISHHIRKIPVVENTEQNSVAYNIEHVEIYEIDINHDGIADFVVHDFGGKYELYGDVFDVNVFHAVFVNINGKWYPFERNYYEPCGGC
jgi:hypothetical protein